MQNHLFFLPIYGHSRDKYYKTHKTICDKNEQFDIPLWKFNDVVGYLDIGMDGSTSLTADIYLKRKNFPRSHKVRYSNYFTTLQNNEFLNYAEINKVRVDIEDNNSFVLGLNEILNRTRKIIKERNSNFQLCTPLFDFKCFNFVEFHKQIKN